LILQHRDAVGEGCPEESYAPNRDCLEDSAAGNPYLTSRRDAFTYVQSDIVFTDARHLFVVGIRTDSQLLQFRVGCIGPESAESGPELNGHAATWVECPEGGDGMNSGHVLLRWTTNGVAYAVSLHGHTSINREVELAIARNIEYVEP